jgi:GDP-D-mannose dehydratase
MGERVALITSITGAYLAQLLFSKCYVVQRRHNRDPHEQNV